ncbi:MAG: hypothetical protein U5R30_06350 [Deltaproteobacteria bacterium]|nr:hypothetical protein [Deltaproteobacteria bacterium]
MISISSSSFSMLDQYQTDERYRSTGWNITFINRLKTHCFLEIYPAFRADAPISQAICAGAPTPPVRGVTTVI